MHVALSARPPLTEAARSIACETIARKRDRPDPSASDQGVRLRQSLLCRKSCCYRRGAAECLRQNGNRFVLRSSCWLKWLGCVGRRPGSFATRLLLTSRRNRLLPQSELECAFGLLIEEFSEPKHFSNVRLC